MQALRFFIDTHDQQHGTFPAGLSAADFEGFYAQYEAACYAEGVIPLRTHLSYADGRAFCLNMAPDAEAVRRAHHGGGRPCDRICYVAPPTPAATAPRPPAGA